MIGYNEQQEALNLLELLRDSRRLLLLFNADNQQIAQAMGIGLLHPQALRQALLQWYGALAGEVQQRRVSGKYALCFSDASQVQRKPYDLLARLEPQAWELEEAELDEALLQGLSADEKTRARRLYHRLLCIQPLRMLLERLMPLVLLMEKGAAGWEEKALQIIGSERFRAPIPLTMERASGQRLDLRDNDFTILDRLMDNWDQPLAGKLDFLMPAEAFSYTACARSLMTAAIVSRMDMPDAQGRQQYQAFPGGHIALGVYDGQNRPDRFFRAVQKAQGKSGKRLLRVHGYARTQLVQLSDAAAGCFGDAAADAFRSCDDGGQNLLLRLNQEVENRLQRRSEQCLKAFVREAPVTDEQRASAMDELRRIVLSCFAAEKLPAALSDEITPMKKDSGKLWQRLVRALLAYQVGLGIQRLPCPRGAAPLPLLALVEKLRREPEAGGQLWKRMEEMAGMGVRLDARYVGKDDARVLFVLCEETVRWEPHAAWLEEAAEAADSPEALRALRQPPFDGASLRQIILEGLQRFLHFRSNVGTGKSSAFSLKTSKRVRPKDIYFRLFCLWCVLVCGDGQDVQLVEDRNDPEKTCLLTRKGAFGFVDLFAETDTEAGGTQLTPARLHAFLQQIARRTLKIRQTADEVFQITVRP